MPSDADDRIERYRVAELPVFQEVARRLGFRDVLDRHITRHGNETVPAVDTTMLLIYNIARSRQPLYELEEWVQSLEPRMFDFEFGEGFSDDRFARAVDKVYKMDRASVMTEVVLSVVKAIDLDMTQLHNDSTSLATAGRVPGRTRDGLFMARGHSKDHRPDLKQLIYCLTVSADGAVPVHFKCYPGNRTDDTTHVETWETLRRIAGRSDFTYVADCKVCTDDQLSHVVGNGGRVVTIVPETWKEVRSFKEKLREGPKRKTVILARRPQRVSDATSEVFSVFDGSHKTAKRGYTIHWIHSSEKKRRDRTARDDRLRKTERDLAVLGGRLNRRKLKTDEQIRAKVDEILEKYRTKGFYHVDVLPVQEQRTRRVGRGRPGKSTVLETYFDTIFTIAWARRKDVLERERRVDGVFPLLSTDPALAPKDVLVAYKYQPRLEKRFQQFKSVHEGAPLLFKRIDRVEAVLFLFFMALILQAAVERHVRQRMKRDGVDTAPAYPEHRRASHPTTAKIIDRFRDVSTYTLVEGGAVKRRYRDSLSATQKELLRLLGMNEEAYWKFDR